MSTGVFMGIKTSFIPEAKKEAENYIKAINKVLYEYELGEYHENDITPDVYENGFFGKSGLDHHSSSCLANFAKFSESKTKPMRSNLNFLLWYLLFSIFACSESVNENLKYLEQKPPSLTPEIFAPGLVSLKTESEFGSVFNKEGTAFYYGVDKDGSTEIRFSELLKNKWTKPKTILSHDEYGFNDPFLSPDENRLYFISKKSLRWCWS